MRDEQAAWQARYAAGQTGWDRGEPSPALAHWLASEHPPKGRVLVPGCGNGYEVAQLVRAGCEVTAVDIAQQPVAALRAKLQQAGLAADVRQADLLRWEPAASFDVIYEQTCLCALNPSDWEAYQARLARWLKPSGVLYGLFMQTGRAGGPPFDCPIPAMQNLFSEEFWSWLQAGPLRVAHPNGLSELGYLLQRKEATA